MQRHKTIAFFYRLGKEKKAYAAEVIQQQNRIQKYKEDGKDEHDIRKQVTLVLSSANP